MNLVVYTAITGRISDELRLPVEAAARYAGQARFVCFTDRARYGDRLGPWEVRPPVWTHPSVPRRTARWHKANAHLLFPDADATAWCDGCFEMRVPPLDLLTLGFPDPGSGPDVSTFRHHERDCIYQEAEACKRLRKDDPATIDAQMARYRAEGFPAGLGLVETTCVLRRNTPEAAAFGAAWWAEMAAGSLRDQLSFNYVSWKLGMPYGVVDGWRERNRYFNFYPHWELPE